MNYIDTGASDIVTTGKLSQKTRHMATKCHYVYQQELRADLLTKGCHPEIIRQRLKLYQGAISLKLLEDRK